MNDHAIARNEERLLREYQKQVELSNVILDEFADARTGGPLAYILTRAAQEAASAMGALASVDPDDRKAIMALQSEIQRQRDLVRWISQAIEQGKEAYSLLTGVDRDAIRDELFDSLEGQI